jgi:sodium/proline symporter
VAFLNFWVFAVFTGYFVILIGIAVVRSRQMRDMSDYVLGSRRMSAFTSALSASSSAASSGTMLVFPALAFVYGAMMIWTALGIVVCAVLSWVILAKRLRRYTIAAGDSLTISEFLEKRFDDRTGTLRTVAAVVSLFFIIIYISSGLVGGSKLLQETFGLEANSGIVVTLIAVASYTLIGGFVAVSRTDVFQALLMLAAFLIIPATLLQVTDNPVWGMMAGESAFLNPFDDPQGNPISWIHILSVPGWGVVAWGSLRVLQRYMALESEDKIPASRNISALWSFLMFGCALVLGWAARPALEQAGMLAAAADPEKLYLVVSEIFFHPVVAGLLLTGVIAAIMSTADSQLLLGSAVAADDLPVLRKFTYSIRTGARIWLGRLLLVVIGGVAAGIAVLQPDSILELVAYAWGGMGAAFGPCIILALYWRRFNFWGAVSSIIAGAAVSSIWGFASGGPGEVWDIMPGTPGFAASAVVGVAATLLTPRPSSETVELFDTVNMPKTAKMAA